MQSSPARGMVPNGHIHPDPSGLQIYQDSLGGIQFDNPEIEAQTRALVEQAQRIGTGPRDAKMAAQRQLGVQAQFQQPYIQGHPTPSAQIRPGTVPMTQPNGHPMTHPNGMAPGQYYLDAQGRPVPVVPFPQYPRPIQHPQMAQPQFQNMSVAQQQNLLHQHFAQQTQIQQQQQQLQQRQQAQFQSQQQLERVGQTPPRPAPMLPPNHQSPGGLRTQPPSLNRSLSRADSRNPSPGPTTRAKSQPTQRAGQAESTPVGIIAATPINGTVKAPSLPNQPVPTHVVTSQSQPSASIQQNTSAVAPKSTLPWPQYNAVSRREEHKALFAEARKKEEKVEHLQRMIEDAQTQLETIIKEGAVVQEAAKIQPSLVEMRERFDKHVLEFLKKAGYEEAATGLQHVMSDRYEHDQDMASTNGDAAVAGGSQSSPSQGGGEANQAGVQKSKASSPTKPRYDKTPTRSPGAQLAFSASHPAMNDRVDDSIPSGRDDASTSQFRSSGSAAPGGASNNEMIVTPTTDDAISDPFIAEVKQESSSPLKKGQGREEQSGNDLGYLYSWWSVFEETQRLTKAKKLDYSVDLHSLTTIPFSAIPPTSALATQIAVSAPAVAVRATSVDAGRTASRMGFAPMTAISNGYVETATDQDDPVNAKLKAAEAMRVAQQAHIDAQNEDKRRQSMADAGMIAGQTDVNVPTNQPQTFILPNGQTVHMTSDQLQQHILAQANQVGQQKHASFPNVLMHPQFHPSAPTGQQNDLQQPTPDRGRPPTVPLGQPHYTSEAAASPSTDSGRSNKRGPEPSPVDMQAKRARVASKRPTPEEHQRQAMEIASRVAGIHSPSSAMLGHIPQPNSGQPPGPIDPHRRYSQAAAQYAQTQLLASPATGFPMSPAHMTSPLEHIHHSPSTPYDMSAHLGINGLGPHSAASANFRRPPGLDMEGMAGENESDRPPPSAASSTKRKATGKKPGPKAGTKRKPAKLKQNSSDTEQEGMITAPHTGIQQSSPISSAFQMNGPPGSALGSGGSKMFPPAGPVEGMPYDSSQFDQGHGYENHPHGTIPQPPQTATMHPTSGPPGIGVNMQNGTLSPHKAGIERNEHGPNEHDDIFKAFEGMAGGEAPMSASNEHFTSFDFDWGSANFGGEDHDWGGMPDTAIPDNIEG